MRSLNINCVLEAIRGLPALPESHTRVMQLSNDPSVSISELSQVISSDVALAAKVLQVANTPFYGMNGRIETIPRALVILGSKTVYSLAVGAGIVDAFQDQDPRHECGIDVWTHCLQTAIAARELAEYDGTIDSDLTFTAGLLHDTGKLVLASLFPEHYRNVLDEHAATAAPLVDLESQIFGISHAGVGATLCKTWNLPRTLGSLVENHHTVSSDPIAIAVEHGNILARLVTPHASGEIHVPVEQLAELFSDSRKLERVRRLVVSQSMQPPVSATDSDTVTSAVSIHVDNPVLNNGLSLVALACGYTPVALEDASTADLVLSDDSLVETSLPVISIGRFLTTMDSSSLLNVAALHRALLLSALTEGTETGLPGVSPQPVVSTSGETG